MVGARSGDPIDDDELTFRRWQTVEPLPSCARRIEQRPSPFGIDTFDPAYEDAGLSRLPDAIGGRAMKPRLPRELQSEPPGRLPSACRVPTRASATSRTTNASSLLTARRGRLSRSQRTPFRSTERRLEPKVGRGGRRRSVVSSVGRATRAAPNARAPWPADSRIELRPNLTDRRRDVASSV